MTDIRDIPNHLKNETSPYLKQHIYNPVDWYPWGEEALQRAKKEEKLIFLSIGYSTCHWCHVMAHESFEDEAVAALLNAHYICIKVDREERPDLDAVYMNYCQMMTGSGGWPLNLFLSPDREPLYAGTYFPKQDMYQRPGFTTVITQLQKMWDKDRNDLLDKAKAIVAHVEGQSLLKPASLDQFVTVQAVRDLKEGFDEDYGGFSEAPKFPSPHQLLFLMHYHKNHPSDSLLSMVTKTLDAMYAGGIYDHIGGGFARYSVDDRWLVPHFEKMLYDNALLLRTYTMAWQLTGNGLYRRIAYHILSFLKREMLHPEGGFYTALDADAEGVEGKSYVFTPDEIDGVLGPGGPAYSDRFGVTSSGNFEGKSIPNLIGKATSEALFDQFIPDNEQLLAYRQQRVQPGRDEKILTSVNGLVITSLAFMSRAFRDSEILGMAVDCAECLEAHCTEGHGLKRHWTDGRSGGSGVLEDYAYYIEGLIELYEASFDRKWLDRALDLSEKVHEAFGDSENGGYFMTASDHERLIGRPKECYDSALPSGNSVMALSLLKLSRLRDSMALEERAAAITNAFGKRILQGPGYFTYMMIPVLYLQEGTKDLVIAAEKPEDLKGLDYPVSAFFTVKAAQENGDKMPLDHRITYYICEDRACRAPVFELDSP